MQAALFSEGETGSDGSMILNPGCKFMPVAGFDWFLPWSKPAGINYFCHLLANTGKNLNGIWFFATYGFFALSLSF